MDGTTKVLGCCVYDREGMISIYSAVYTTEPHPDGEHVIWKLVPCSSRELRFPYDARGNGHPDAETVMRILQHHGKEDFFERA